MRDKPQFYRSQLLVGEDGVRKLGETRVILFGVGGVGSWAAEALVRSGIGHLTIVDSDVICVTNINRQIQATSKNVGRSKVDELARRLRDIHPGAEIIPRMEVYDWDRFESFDLKSYDYVLDAIDSVANKVLLLFRGLRDGATLFSAMGASCKLDPSRIRVGSFWSVRGCPLAKHVRKRVRTRMRNEGIEGDFLCVYSSEQLPPFDGPVSCGSAECYCPERTPEGAGITSAHEWCSSKKQINGSMVHLTGIFGFQLAGLVIRDVVGHPLSPGD